MNEIKREMISELEKQRDQICEALNGRIAELRAELGETSELESLVGKFYRYDDSRIYIVGEKFNHEGNEAYSVVAVDNYSDWMKFEENMLYVEDFEDMEEINKETALEYFRKLCKTMEVDWFGEVKVNSTLTETERKICELFEGKEYYIARDKDGTLFGYTDKPRKYKNFWTAGKHDVYKDNWFNIEGVLKHLGVEFDFIQWEDTEPWSIADLLKLEVKEE